MNQPSWQHALVYVCVGTAGFVEGDSPVGCGALVEGGFVATCRHVWEDAVRALADGVGTIVIKYPFAEANDAGCHPAVLADDCRAGTKQAPDLVLLEASQAPPELPPLRLPGRPATEDGEASVHTYFARLDQTQSFAGVISAEATTRGYRGLTGPTNTAYWLEPGGSGGPAFLKQHRLFAGLVREAEIGANQGKSDLREAVIVPASMVRRHVTRLVFDRATRDHGADPARFSRIRDRVCGSDILVGDISGTVADMINEMRDPESGTAKPPPPPPDTAGPDIAAAIEASRDKLTALQPDAALGILEEKIVELRQSHLMRIKPLLIERARIQTLTYDRAGARGTLEDIGRLDAEDAWCMVEIGDLWWIDGETGRAAEAFQRALAIATRTGVPSGVAVCQDRLGDVLVAQGKLAEALQAFRDGLAIRERLARADADNAGWQRDLSVSYNRIGDVLVAQGKLAEALQAFRDGLAIGERLARADADNAGWQRDLSVSYNRIGDVLVAQGKLAEALQAFRDGLAIRERLARADADNAGWQRDLSVSYNKIGDVLVAQGKLAEALQAFRDGLAIRERLARADADNAGWQRDLSVSYNKIGDVLVAQGKLAEALQAFRDGLAIGERLARADADNAGWQRDLSVSYDRIGDVLVAQGKLAEALQAFRDGLAIRERLARADADNAGWQRDLAVSHGNVAKVSARAGDFAGALADFLCSHAIMVQLIAQQPDHPGWQQDLAWLSDRIAELQG